MRILTIITLQVTLTWHNVVCRGPHHPRGDSIARQHVHYKPTKDVDQNIIQDSDLLHDKEHLEEHLEDLIDTPDLDSLTDEELDFYYFQVHDVDRNNKLDGLEILQAIQHTHHEHNDDDGDGGGDGEEGKNAEYQDKDLAEEVQTRLEYYTELIDKVFAEDDVDDDGYLSYPEYKAGREKEAKIPTGRKTSYSQAHPQPQPQPQPQPPVNPQSDHTHHSEQLPSVQMS